jgi:uncharacterized membrane protein
MNTGSLTADFIVLAAGVVLCVMPAVTRPTLQFGVRIPAEQSYAPVMRHQRRVYYWRAAVIGACCTAAVLVFQDQGSWWLSKVILLLEVVADLGCFWIARHKILFVKHAAGWFTGRPQLVTADTSWRTNPLGFPWLWLLPAVVVTVATTVIGAARYPNLPAHLPTGFGLGGAPRHWVAKSPVGVFAVVAGQAYVTVLWIGLLLIIYRTRPDIEATDAAASVRRYRSFLATATRAMLTLVALVDLSLLLSALRNWQVYRLSGIGSSLPLLPFLVGTIVLGSVALRAGQGGSRLAGRSDRLSLATAGPDYDRDDDRFWKGGLIYVNRDDPAIMVGNRFGVGWTFNLGNLTAWLVIAGIVIAPAGLAVIRAAAGL